MGTNKAALEAMCRYFVVALARRGITVNAICPGITDDSIVNKLPQAAQEAMFAWLRAGWSPSGRAGTPQDIGGAVLTPKQKTRIWVEHHLLGRISPVVTFLAYLFLFLPIVVR